MIDQKQALVQIAAANPIPETASLTAEERAEARRVRERVLSAPESVEPAGGDG